MWYVLKSGARNHYTKQSLTAKHTLHSGWNFSHNPKYTHTKEGYALKMQRCLMQESTWRVVNPMPRDWNTRRQLFYPVCHLWSRCHLHWLSSGCFWLAALLHLQQLASNDKVFDHKDSMWIHVEKAAVLLVLEREGCSKRTVKMADTAAPEEQLWGLG